MASIVWKGFINFGLVSFPVRLFTAARAETMHFHMLHRKDLSRVKEVWYCAKENKPIQRSEIAKGFETGKDSYVVLEDDELKKIAPSTQTVMEILQFVPAGEVDPIYFERSYYVTADEKLTKPYILFVRALEETKQCALAKVTMHGREHLVMMRVSSGALLLHTLYYADELHAANRPARATSDSFSKKELELAKQLVEQLSGKFKPEEFHDTYRENVNKLIEQKKAGEKVIPIRQRKRAPVVDLMEALQASLKASRGAQTSKVPKKRKTA